MIHRLYRPGMVVIPCYRDDVQTTFLTLGPLADLPAAGGEQIEVVSGQAADDAAGTGARKIKLLVVRADFSFAVVEVTLAGLTPVVADSVIDYVFIADAWVSEVGSGGSNAGAITIRKVSAGGDRMKMILGHNRAFAGQYMVPAGHVFEVRGCHVNTQALSGTTPLTIEVRIETNVDPEGNLTSIFRPIAVEESSYQKTLDIVTPREAVLGLIPAGGIVRVTGRVGTATNTLFGGILFGKLIKLSTAAEDGS